MLLVVTPVKNRFPMVLLSTGYQSDGGQDLYQERWGNAVRAGRKLQFQDNG